MAGFDFIFLFGSLFIMQKVDFTNPTNIQIALVAFGLIQTLCAVCYFIIFQKVSKKAAGPQIEITTPASFGSQEKVEKMTAKEYDMSQVKKAATQLIMGAGIPLFLFYKFGIAPPLAMNCVFGPQNLYKNKLFKLYILGEDETKYPRPWTEENPFASLLGGAGAAAPAGAAEQAAAEDNSGNIRIPAGEETVAVDKKKKKAKIVEVNSDDDEVPQVEENKEASGKKSPVQRRKKVD
ncbi:hypothetical protein DFA_07356 [Cavenderia fasciculata]|uniref:Transmembrane protein n=1 Tax=Cavenderia fasciculata TaxID=261658 RepID=F4PW71_CACFS|nr:uncharacterized protein DFA_07356 [Cavenderia fasciculata]EGG20235.1 hypothetical protein DFA_07356 [Cavenderia fasciculata]|eukprot:XP_004367218.1 hypothetical protein DFA_07356 [Cavenderia fasciculata]